MPAEPRECNEVVQPGSTVREGIYSESNLVALMPKLRSLDEYKTEAQAVVLHLLEGEEVNKGELARRIGRTAPTVAKVMEAMLQAQLVQMRQQGRAQYFSLAVGGATTPVHVAAPTAGSNTSTACSDGHGARSQLERIVDDRLYELGIIHWREWPYRSLLLHWGQGKHTVDFLLSPTTVIEVWGGPWKDDADYSQLRRRKTRALEAGGMRLIAVDGKKDAKRFIRSELRVQLDRELLEGGPSFLRMVAALRPDDAGTDELRRRLIQAAHRRARDELSRLNLQGRRPVAKKSGQMVLPLQWREPSLFEQYSGVACVFGPEHQVALALVPASEQEDYIRRFHDLGGDDSGCPSEDAASELPE